METEKRPSAHEQLGDGDPGGREPDDRRLVELAVRGDSRAFERLIANHREKVFHLARGIVSDWHQAEDVCQEVFATLFRKLKDFRHESSLGTWIFRVTVNAALKSRRRRRNAAEILEPGRLAARKGGRPAFEGEEAFRKLLRPLPEKLRVPVILREAGDLSYDEIARVLGCSRGAVEQRLHRAMVLLREIWKDQKDGLR